ncbi:MAG: SpoVG family protein [Gemmatales bacterium]|nr:SpoVG family protein [Gemmatales bacterium]MDW7995418.1 SpoVG family protein [Gemmatales bacterium]
MEITEIRIKLMDEKKGGNERLQAFCSITFDNMFVVRDLKIIEGAKGQFVAMPSRKLADRCPTCGCKNHLQARFCNHCGRRLNENRAPRDASGRIRLHADVAHPINAKSREYIERAILKAYYEELERAKQPGYVCRYDDYETEDDYDGYEAASRAPQHTEPVRCDLGHSQVAPTAAGSRETIAPSESANAARQCANGRP